MIIPSGTESLGPRQLASLLIEDHLWSNLATITRYSISGRELSTQDIDRCVEIIGNGQAADIESAARELPRSSVVVVALCGKDIVGVGAIKRVCAGYTAHIAEKSGIALSPQTHELGYVAVDEKHRGRRLAHRIVTALIQQHGKSPLFATTDSEHMKRTLAATRFVRKGRMWAGNRGQLSLWFKE